MIHDDIKNVPRGTQATKNKIFEILNNDEHHDRKAFKVLLKRASLQTAQS
jgi:hypothetical protein